MEAGEKKSLVFWVLEMECVVCTDIFAYTKTSQVFLRMLIFWEQTKSVLLLIFD